jgi:hypothetical protein
MTSDVEALNELFSAVVVSFFGGARALAALAPTFTSAAREALAALDLDHGNLTEVVKIAVAAAAVLPPAEQRATLEALLDARAGRGSDDRYGWALRVLVPHLPADLLERALRDADSDLDALLIAVQGAWPPDRRSAAEAAARGALERCLRDRFQYPQVWLELVAPRLPAPLLREAIANTLRPDDAPHEPEWMLQILLPCLARRGAAAEAVEHARAVVQDRPRIHLLGLLLPHLPPPLRDAAAAEVLARVHALPPGPIADDDEQRWVVSFLEAACALAPLGHAPAVAAAANRTLGASSALSILLMLMLAGGVRAPERRELLADAIDRALGLPDDHLPGVLPGFLAHAAALERRPFAALLARALKAGARRGRARFLTEEHDEERPRQMARALLALGGEAAVLAAKRACVEVGRWFP